VQECFTEERHKTNFLLKTHWNMLLIGEAGTGMFNHQDTLRTASWQVRRDWSAVNFTMKLYDG
jgi:hypothetical protein